MPVLFEETLLAPEPGPCACLAREREELDLARSH